MKLNNKSLYIFFKEYSSCHGDDVFILDENVRYTVRQAFEIVCGLAEQLRKSGIKCGDYIDIKADRKPEMVLLFYAIQFIDAIAVMHDPHEDIAGKIRVVDRTLHIEDQTISLCFDGCSNIKDFNHTTDSKATSVIIFTSGSTGDKKAVCLSQYSFINVSLEIEPNCGFFEDDMVILLVPIHYVFGLYTIFSAVVTKQSMFIPQSLDIDHIVDCMIKYPITRINAVPSLFLALANNVRAKEIKNLRYGFIGGAPHTIEQFTQIEHNLGITLIPAYGMSECIGIAIGNYRDSLQNRSSNVGKVYSIHQKKFLSDGELCIKSPVLALEYLNIGPVTDADGWLHTGDLGRIDEQGYLHIEGRKKDIIIRNGNNISTIKIEAALLTLRYIESVAVVGVFDDRQGEVPCALAVLKNGEEKSEKEILDDLMMVLKKIEIPSRIIIVEKIPMTSTGKADKVLIKQIYAEHVKRANSE